MAWAPLIILCLLSYVTNLEVTANHMLDCCISYMKRPLSIKMIEKYTFQWSWEVCNIDAVIFHTKRGFKLCANPNDSWVKKILKFFRLKVKRKRVKKKNPNSPYSVSSLWK